MMNLDTILIVEDEVLMAMCVEMELKKKGARNIRAVTTGRDAVRAARAGHPSLILMDIRLAGDMDGLETARRIRTFSQNPIIFLTGYLVDDVEERAHGLAHARLLTKPVDIDAILEAAAELAASN